MRRLFRLWRFAGQDLRMLCVALAREDRPAWLWPAAVALGIFALDPLNLALPGLGIIDDFVLLPLLLRALVAAANSVGRHKPSNRVVSIQ